MQLTKMSDRDEWANFTFSDGYELYFELGPTNKNVVEVKTVIVMRAVEEVAKLHVGPATIGTSSISLHPDFTQKMVAERWLAIIDYFKRHKDEKDISESNQAILSSARSQKVIADLKEQKVRLGT